MTERGKNQTVVIRVPPWMMNHVSKLSEITGRAVGSYFRELVEAGWCEEGKRLTELAVRLSEARQVSAHDLNTPRTEPQPLELKLKPKRTVVRPDSEVSLGKSAEGR